MASVRSLIAATAAVLAVSAGPAPAQTTINLTAIDGYPPKSLWIKEFVDFYIPEVDKRLAKSNKFKIRWNQAWGGQIVKPNGVLEGVQKGLGDVGIVTTAIYGDKMRILAVAYATPFVSNDPALVAKTIDAMAEKFPAIKKTFASYNQVYLTNSVVLDTYQVFAKKELRNLGDMKGMKIAGAGFNLRYLGPVGAVGVAGPLAQYYNQIQTGVVEGCMLWPEAAATFKLAEVAPFMLRADLGTVNTKVLTVNADTWKRLPDEVKTVMQEVAIEYRDLLARIAATEGADSVAAYKKAGGAVHDLSRAERSKWARDLPNLAKEWAAGLDKEGAQGSEMLSFYMDAMRAASQPIERQWDRE
ncbi:MAG: C4-dicarboxylate TRAP transporter substrate-binding protein [Burkholderiaceae bacterium]|nr:C4-dicarboxylate TRAP transporter substrate-binding protein [Burkholderiaceae bacterium]